ncbi:MAG TPA: LuxR C-terminal-related transcriptional regulator [Candidatus Elarobacter sp.]|nr:LuxR C-terminal-related transcriptional regulator [Candidatus Elarobacter sp.]
MSPTVAAAYAVSIAGSRQDAVAMLERLDRASTAGLLLAAVVAACDGDRLRSEATLRRAIEAAHDTDRGYLVDLLVPLLVARGLVTRAAALLDTIAFDQHHAIGQLALRAVIDAAGGASASSAAAAEAVRAAFAHGAHDEVTRLRVHEHLALAASYRGKASVALDEVERGLRIVHARRAPRAATALRAIAYAAHARLTGDADAAWREANAMLGAAQAAGDVATRGLARAAIYELSAERGDDEEIERSHAAFESEPAGDEHRTRFGVGVADILRLALRGEVESARDVATALAQSAARSDGERALCETLLALVAVALGDDLSARRCCRRARTALRMVPTNALPGEVRYRRIAASLCALAAPWAAGEAASGRLTGASTRKDPEANALHGLGARTSLDDVPVTVRGYARLACIARPARDSRNARDPLTATEREILGLLAAGCNAAEAARITDRNVQTVRTHIRNAAAKLGAHGRADLLARALRLGITAEHASP